MGLYQKVIVSLLGADGSGNIDTETHQVCVVMCTADVGGHLIDTTLVCLNII